MTSSLIKLFKRDLNRLAEEINAYSNDTVLWKTNATIKNSGGNLAMHLMGNLNHYIGAVLGNTGYVRQRDNEFNDKNISRDLLINQLKELKEVLNKVLLSLTQEDLNKIYPINVLGKEMTTEFFLIHLYGHFNYHLGQINYHRRMLEIGS